MRYVSTRGAAVGRYSDALIQGLASDGGLVVPDTLPHISPTDFDQWRDLPYPDLAARVIALFATDIPFEDLSRMCANAYAPEKFTDPDVVSLRDIGEGMSTVGLSEGPTLAFKDMAMQFLGEVIEYVLARDSRTLNIVGATSGDTGSAAEQAFRGRARIQVFMLSPKGRMSPFQRAQMYSIPDENIHNLVVDGVFDDCQDIVKDVLADTSFKETHRLGAVNSINFGRISAQIVYYVWAWLRSTDAVPTNERQHTEVSFAVPSGNFGNALSGHYARAMGVPIRSLVLACNENNVLDEFFATGTYRPRSRTQTVATSSPSMDVSKASNLERLVFDLLGRDPSQTAQAWEDLGTDGFLNLTPHHTRFARELRFESGTSTHSDRLQTIRTVFKAAGAMVDPHTADGIGVARSLVEDGVRMLVLETAKPQKFAETMVEALGIEPEMTLRDVSMMQAPQRYSPISADAAALRAFIATRVSASAGTIESA